jgi:hypothetical protein
MRQTARPRDRLNRLCGALATLLLGALPLDRAAAADLPGPHPRAATGRSQLKAVDKLPALGLAVNPALSGRFEENRLSSKVMWRLRPIPFLGAEPTEFLRGVGTCSVNHPTCDPQPSRLHRSDAGFASGVGAQFEPGSWALSTGARRTTVGGPEVPAGFRENFVFRVTSALRSIPLLGAELAHIDLGHPSGRPGGFPTDASMRGSAAFGVLHLPLPVPVVDVYAKAGLARLKSTLHYNAFRPGVGTCSVSDPTCSLQLPQVDRIDTTFAGGAGVQFKLSSWALSAEYKRFIAAGGHPGLASVTFSWSFP